MDETPTPIDGPMHDGDSVPLGQGAIGDLFEKGSNLFSTRSAEAFEATDRRRGDRVHLWTLRYPLALDSDAPRQFVRRIAQISRLQAAIPRVRAYGVDARGIAYAALEYVRGRSPLEQGSSARIAERTFIEILQAMDVIHRERISLEDVCFDSFALDERGRIVVWGIMGSFDAGARQTAILPPPETLPFLAPEQRTVGSTGVTADIFALGVYGYRLFTGRSVPPEVLASGASDLTAVLPPPSSVRSDLPTWVDDVLGRCLETNPTARYQDASEMLHVIQGAISSGAPPGGQSKWSRRTLVVSKQVDQTIRPRALDRASSAHVPSTITDAARARATKRVSKAVNTFTWTVAVLVGLLGAGLVFYAFEKMSGGKAEDPCNIIAHSEYAPSDLKPLIFDVSATESPLDRRESALKKIAENKDPIAYAILVSFTGCRTENRLATLAEQLLIERIRGQGTERAATVLEKWFGETSSRGVIPAQQPEFSLLLRAVDTSRPLESRQQALREAFAIAQPIAIKVAGALTLDEKEERFSSVLRELMRTAQPSVNFEKRGVGALILSSPILGATFVAELAGLIPRFSDDDLRWVAERLADVDNVFVYDVARELVKRKLFPPFQTVFLKALSDAQKYKVTTPVQQGLIHGGLGILTADDVRQLGRWMSLDAEDCLLAASATARELPVGVEAFEILASRTLNNEPGTSLMKWVKTHFWDYRTKIARPVGILALTDVASDTELEYGFNELLPFAPGGELFRSIIQSRNEKLIRIALAKLGEITPGEELLPLLEHKSRSVRMETVKSLKGRNELGILQGILQAYAREQDEEVRAVYRQFHWVTQDRDPNKIFK